MTSTEDRHSAKWTAALKRVQGEFRRSRLDEVYLQFPALVAMITGGQLVWQALAGPRAGLDRWIDSLVGLAGIGLIGVGLLIAIRFVGTRYRFADGMVCEISARGRIRWQEPVATLQSVRSLRGGRGLPSLMLHWETVRRRVELFDSLDAAAREHLRERLPDLAVTTEAGTEAEPPPWRCGGCGEQNPETFEVCWHCEAARAPTTQLANSKPPDEAT